MKLFLILEPGENRKIYENKGKLRETTKKKETLFENKEKSFLWLQWWVNLK